MLQVSAEKTWPLQKDGITGQQNATNRVSCNMANGRYTATQNKCIEKLRLANCKTACQWGWQTFEVLSASKANTVSDLS
jgi:hypothetical protein